MLTKIYTPTFKINPLTAISLFMTLGFSVNAFAEKDATPLKTMADIKTMIEMPEKDPTDTIEKVTNLPKKNRSSNKETSISEYKLDNLLKNVNLFSYHLNQVIAARNLARLEYLLPHYRKMPKNDPSLILFAEALLYSLKGNNKQAIALYKKLLAKDPSFHPVRLHLAMSLIDDKQYQNAKIQLIKLKSSSLPPPILTIIDANLRRIDSVDDWKFNLSGNYINDPNINGAPSKKINTKFGSSVDPIEAHGIRINGSVYKKFNLVNNFYTALSGGASGNAYWNVDGYNDYSLTGSSAIGYMNAKTDVAIKPFINKRFYDDQAYSTKYGVNVTGGHWVTPKLRVSGNAQYNEEFHDDKENESRDSENYLLAANGVYIQNPSQYFFGGVSHYRNDVPKSAIISYKKDAGYVGWNKEWDKGISSTVTAKFSQKKYDSPVDEPNLDLDAYYSAYQGKKGTSRTDKTHSVSTELWKRDYNLVGLTPKLIIDYSKTNSNFLYYDDQDSLSSTVELTKSF